MRIRQCLAIPLSLMMFITPAAFSEDLCQFIATGLQEQKLNLHSDVFDDPSGENDWRMSTNLCYKAVLEKGIDVQVIGSYGRQGRDKMRAIAGCSCDHNGNHWTCNWNTKLKGNCVVRQVENKDSEKVVSI